MNESILLVEDNPHDVEITLDLIAESRPGSTVTVVHNGQEALDFLYRRGEFRLSPATQPSVILLDVKMPKIGGLELLGRLRGDPAMGRIAVVMISSSRHETDLLEAYDQQADGYLIKPVKPQQLVAAIELAIRTRRRAADGPPGDSS